MLRRLVICALTLMLCAMTGPSLAASPAPREVLVLGGTGQLGAEIVRLLVQQGDHVIVLTRGKSDHARLEGLPVTYVTGDLTNEADVAAAFRGRRIEYVVNAVRAERSDLHFYEKVMPALVSNAKAAGVKQFVHQSAAGAGNSLAKMDTAGWDKVPGLLERIRDQTVGEEMLTRSGVPYTIIRNARLYPDGTPATGKAELTEDESVLTPMTRPDLARLTVSCVGSKTCLNKVYHVRDTTLSWPPPGGMR